MSDFFKFEDDGIDFPFYNGIPELSIVEWVVLAVGPVLVALFALTGGDFIPYFNSLPNGAMQISYFLFTIIPFAYVCHGKLGLIFKKTRLKDFKIIIPCIILYILYAGLTRVLGGYLGFSAASNPITQSAVSILDVVFILFQLMAEELFKVAVLLIAMGLIYYFTKNRKTTLVFAIFISVMLFGLIHLATYEYNLYQCIVVIGIGSLIHLYPYLKTKNVFNSYLVHIMIDLILIGIMSIPH